MRPGCRGGGRRSRPRGLRAPPPTGGARGPTRRGTRWRRGCRRRFPTRSCGAGRAGQEGGWPAGFGEVGPGSDPDTGTAANLPEAVQRERVTRARSSRSRPECARVEANVRMGCGGGGGGALGSAQHRPGGRNPFDGAAPWGRESRSRLPGDVRFRLAALGDADRRSALRAAAPRPQVAIRASAGLWARHAGVKTGGRSRRPPTSTAASATDTHPSTSTRPGRAARSSLRPSPTSVSYN